MDTGDAIMVIFWIALSLYLLSLPTRMMFKREDENTLFMFLSLPVAIVMSIAMGYLVGWISWSLGSRELGWALASGVGTLFFSWVGMMGYAIQRKINP